jgi:hypothetical protein
MAARRARAEPPSYLKKITSPRPGRSASRRRRWTPAAPKTRLTLEAWHLGVAGNGVSKGVVPDSVGCGDWGGPRSLVVLRSIDFTEGGGDGMGSSNLAYPNFVSLTSGTHHIWAHLSVTQSQKKLGLESQRIRLRRGLGRRRVKKPGHNKYPVGHEAVISSKYPACKTQIHQAIRERFDGPRQMSNVHIGERSTRELVCNSPKNQCNI